MKIKKLLIYALLIVFVFLLAACSDTPPYSVENSENAPTTVIVGDVRLQFLSQSLLRIEERGENGGFEDRESLVVSNRKSQTPIKVTVKEEKKSVVISTSEREITVKKKAKTPADVSISENGSTIWNFEGKTNSNVFLPAASDELSSWYFCDYPRIIPSESGYALNPASEDLNGWEIDKESLDVFVFTPKGDYKEFLKDFITLTGRSELISRELLGYWDSRYFEYSEESAKAQIEDYISKGFPLDVLVIDTDWRYGGYGTGYDLNIELWDSYENLSSFFKWCEDKGISVVFNDHPVPIDGTDNTLDKEEIEFRNNSLTMYLSLGLDGWWYDRNWWSTLNPPDEDFSRYAFGMYVYFDITENYHEESQPQKRTMIMANVDGINNGARAYASSLIAHRYTLQWTGDIAVDMDSLSQEVENAVYYGMTGALPYVSSDLGGHTADATPEQYIRWLQYGTLSAICRVHCTKPYSRMPWLYGDLVESLSKDYINMRYRLLAYIYGAARESYDFGLPIMRSLSIEYPEFAESLRTDEYTLGSDVLVAPVMTPFSEKRAVLEENYLTDIKAKFYNGEEAFEKDDAAYATDLESLNFDYGTGKSPSKKVNHDYFYARISTTLDLPEDGAFLSFTVDDGIRVKINGNLVIDEWHAGNSAEYITPFYEKGEPLKLEIEYMEMDGGCKLQTCFKLKPTETVTRDVFLPEGTWIDVWTGDRYTGPVTIEATHKLETSPIFIRSGSVIPLLGEAQNTSEQDYSEITLDVYPENGVNSCCLYEDDGKSVAYKSGAFRKTQITSTLSDKTLTLDVGKAVGSFEGSEKFSQRTWKVRIHNASMGKAVSALVDGISVETEYYPKESGVMPFMTAEGSADSDVTEIVCTADLAEGFKLTIEFENAEKTAETPDYDDSHAELSIEEISVLPAVFLGKKSTNFEKNPPEELLSYEIKGNEGGRSHSFTFKVGKDRQCYVLRVGGKNSLAVLTVRDRSGKVYTEYLGGKGKYVKNYLVTCRGDKESEIYATYTILSGDSIYVKCLLSYPESVVMTAKFQAPIFSLIAVIGLAAIILPVVVLLKKRKKKA